MANVVRNKFGYYQIPGFNKLFPSVTTILKVISQPYLGKWREKLILDAFEAEILACAEPLSQDSVSAVRQRAVHAPDEVLQAAGDFGTRSHVAIQTMIEQKQPFDEAPDLRPVVDAFLQWQARMHVEQIQSERLVYSDEHTFAGTVDAVGYRTRPDGRRVKVVIDWKTSSSISPNFALQLSAYARAIEEMDGDPVEEAWVVQFDKQAPKYSCYQVRDMAKSWQAFRSTLQLWRFLQQSAHFDLDSLHIKN